MLLITSVSIFMVLQLYLRILTYRRNIRFLQNLLTIIFFLELINFFRMEDALDITLQKYNRREWAGEGKNKFIEKKRIWSLIRRIRIFIH